MLDFVENPSCALFDWLTVSERSLDEKERRYIYMCACGCEDARVVVYMCVCDECM